jgi:DNA-binding NarL/FixJ family response regulator
VTRPAKRAPIRVILADDHHLYRRCLGAIMTLDGDIEVVGEAADGYEALDLAVAVRPDVIVIDLRMPRLDGIDAVRAICKRLPTSRILMLTMSEGSESLMQALDAGVAGYVYKDASAEEVTDAVRRVHRGERVVPPLHRTLAMPDRS